MSPEEINGYLRDNKEEVKDLEEHELMALSLEIFRKLDFEPIWNQIDLLYEIARTEENWEEE